MSIDIFEGKKAKRVADALESISGNLANLIAPDVAQETAVIAEAKRWVDGKDLAGNPVPSTAPQYENNAKYYMEQTKASVPADYSELIGDVEDLKSAFNGTIASIIDNTNIFDATNADCRALFINTSSNTIKSANTNRLVVVPIKTNAAYMVSCAGSSTKRVATTAANPALNVAASNISEFVGEITNHVVNNTTDNYLVIQLFVDSDADQTPANYYSSIIVNEFSAKDQTVRKDVGSIKSAVDYVIVGTESVDFSELSTTPYNISPSVGKWTQNANYQSYFIQKPENAFEIIFTANAENDSVFAMLKNDSHVVGDVSTYATGQTRTVVNAGETLVQTIPNDCAYIWVFKTTDGGTTDYLPQSVQFHVYKTIPNVDESLTVSGDAADAKATGDAISMLRNETEDEIEKIWNGDTGVFQYTQAQLISAFGKYSEGYQYSAANSVVGKVFPSEIASTEATGSYDVMIDISDAISFSYPKYKNISGRGCLLLDSNYVVTRNLPNLTDDTGTMATVNVASGEKYFVFGVNGGLAGMTWTFTITKQPTKGIHDIEKDVSEINESIADIEEDVQKNADDIARIMDGGLFPAPTLNAEIVGFICYGQSWSMGYDTNAITGTQRYDNIMLDSGLMNDPATDLVISATAFSPLIEQTVWSSQSQSQKCGETPCTGQTDIVKQLLLSENGLSDTDVKYQIFSAAPGMGSKSIEQLSKGTDYYTRLIDVVTTANNIARAQGKVFVIPAISWTQGSSTGSDATYYDLLEQLRVDLDTDIKAITGQTIPVKLIAWQAITPNTTPKRFYDRYVYASEKYENIICSGTFYMFEHRADNNLHLTANHQDWLGCQLGIAYKRSIVDGEKFIPLKPKSVEVYGNIAYLDFYVPVKPLVFDTTLVASISNYGFQIFDNSNTEKTISAVEIIAPDRVKIVCASNLASTDHIVYGGNGTDAYNPQTGKRGNLRDSQPIVYKNHQNVDLPCYNWCVVFDKTIAELTPST